MEQKSGCISRCSPFVDQRALLHMQRFTSAYLSYTHLVGGEGAGLVGADD